MNSSLSKTFTCLIIHCSSNFSNAQTLHTLLLCVVDRNTHPIVLLGDLFNYMTDNLTREVTNRVAWLGVYRDKDIRQYSMSEQVLTVRVQRDIKIMPDDSLKGLGEILSQGYFDTLHFTHYILRTKWQMKWPVDQGTLNLLIWQHILQIISYEKKFYTLYIMSLYMLILIKSVMKMYLIRIINLLIDMFANHVINLIV